MLFGPTPMSDIFVTRHEKGAWSDEVFEALARVLGPGSGPGRAILEHELLRCDLLYLASDAEGPCASCSARGCGCRWARSGDRPDTWA